MFIYADSYDNAPDYDRPEYEVDRDDYEYAQEMCTRSRLDPLNQTDRYRY